MRVSDSTFVRIERYVDLALFPLGIIMTIFACMGIIVFVGQMAEMDNNNPCVDDSCKIQREINWTGISILTYTPIAFIGILFIRLWKRMRKP